MKSAADPRTLGRNRPEKFSSEAAGFGVVDIDPEQVLQRGSGRKVVRGSVFQHFVFGKVDSDPE